MSLTRQIGARLQIAMHLSDAAFSEGSRAQDTTKVRERKRRQPDVNRLADST
eukprot:CAMPEP_0184378320 /NCGR_PEP_ID=MMETSP0007-20130409/2966_1 /TAXON_ID=97485 /ORGANISM="Prymnesium parvum, Strain Texoma1" /LENGTH=51 /DNA_ID=CAMNT_0026722545 /DNA_START=134 /DNA_END=285 /DNA_ORIENTATION=-